MIFDFPVPTAFCGIDDRNCYQQSATATTEQYWDNLILGICNINHSAYIASEKSFDRPLNALIIGRHTMHCPPKVQSCTGGGLKKLKLAQLSLPALSPTDADVQV